MAFDELIDNAKQAGATTVHAVFGFDGNKSDKKPSHIAIIDNGHGMEPDMIRAAVTWGGTHREGDRTGFGRYGYGLPSACVGTGKRYTVYSKQAGGEVHAVTIDIHEISNGSYNTPDGDIVVPEAVKAKLPHFVDEYISKYFPKFASGTVIVIEQLDKLTWKTAGSLQEESPLPLRGRLSLLRADLDIWVNEKRVEPIDPLFITPNYRWFDLDEDRAHPLDPIVIDVKNPETREIEGQITVRLSYMPPTFASIDKQRDATAKNANERFAVMKDYKSFIFARMGRIIDVVTRSDLTVFQNNDRYIKVEIDFPAVLDEEFNVTTSKQQIVPSDRMWTSCVSMVFSKRLSNCANAAMREKAKHRDDRDRNTEAKRPSEEAMERSAILTAKPSPEVVARKQAMGEKGITQEAERRARSTGKPVEEARKELEFELQGKMYKVATESMPGGPFFRMDMFGGTKVLFLNTAHPFYKEIHSGPQSTPTVRSALEIFLFSIGDRILETSENLHDIDANEVPEWSKKLAYALAQLAEGIGNPEDDGNDNLQAAE